MIEFVGSVMVVLCGYFIGFMQADKLNKLCRNLHTAVQMMNDVYIMLDSAFLSRDEIFGNLEKQEKYFRFKNLFYDEKIVEKILPEDDCLRLEEYFNQLGSTDINGQLMKTKLCINELNSSEKELYEKSNRCEKLYKAMGIMSGLMIVISFI